MKLENCYRCNALAKTREHVPPKCFFPEQKDTPGENFRKELITVPSCEMHNTQKSSDDEFLMASLASIVGNNFIGFVHTKTKLRRSFERKKGDYAHTLMSEPNDYIMESNGIKFPIVVGKPHVKRLKRCIESIAYGLHYHQFGRRFVGKIFMVMKPSLYNDKLFDDRYEIFTRGFNGLAANCDIKGANPKIFTFQFSNTDKFGMFMLKIVFYEFTEVLLVFQDRNAQRKFKDDPEWKLLRQLKRDGGKITVSFGDENFRLS